MGRKSFWEMVAPFSKHGDDILRWTLKGIDIREFMVPFKGIYKGKAYDTSCPPPRRFKNSKSLGNFDKFITDTVASEIACGAASVVDDNPWLIVEPISIEPTKPRKIHDARYVNLWMNAPKFHQKAAAQVR